MNTPSLSTDAITVVSGLPRSGTSMLMKMLEAGGIPPLTDGLRSADEDNPKGYFEHEGVKQLAKDKSFIPTARGKAIKVISELLYHLPEGEEYRVIFLRRNIDEILRSQEQMLHRRGTFREGGPSDAMMRPILKKSALKAMNHVVDREDMRMLVVDHHAAFTDTAGLVVKISDFLGGGLDREAMTAVVDPALYRQRSE